MMGTRVVVNEVGTGNEADHGQTLPESMSLYLHDSRERSRVAGGVRKMMSDDSCVTKPNPVTHQSSLIVLAPKIDPA
jgi:hypothetical protein